MFMWKSPGKPGLACSCLPLFPKALSTQSRAASNRLGLSYKETLAAVPRKISVCRDWGFPAPPPSFRGPALDKMDRFHPACVPGPSENSLEWRCFCREGSGFSPTVGRCWVSCVQERGSSMWVHFMIAHPWSERLSFSSANTAPLSLLNFTRVSFSPGP